VISNLPKQFLLAPAPDRLLPFRARTGVALMQAVRELQHKPSVILIRLLNLFLGRDSVFTWAAGLRVDCLACAAEE
jgi:hypothetical protein